MYQYEEQEHAPARGAKAVTRRQFIRAAAVIASASALPACTWRMPQSGKSIHKENVNPTIALPPMLVDALRIDDPAVQADAARLIGDLRADDSVEPLVNYVRGSRYYSKTAGFDALARIGDPECCAQIRPLLEAPNVPDDIVWYGRESVILFAALALLHLGDDSGEAILLDESQNLRNWAFFTWLAPSVLRLPDDLEASRRVKARFTLEKLLPPGKSDPGQLAYASDAVGLMNGQAARAALRQLCANPSRYVRARAALNLLAISESTQDVERIEEIAISDPTLFARVKAAQALALIGRRDHTEQIASAVRDATNEFDRAAAIDSLGIVGSSDYTGIVVEQLRSDDSYVRQCAVEALDRIGTPDAISGASKMRRDPEIRVRLQAAKCLAAHASARGGI